ncbi:TonB-linked SusC/RagA family outer membrane protein [Moheibacter stercoris]|uniref:TonB-linked SusC/RagA family outer membrane protein n=1 Tax=Moheibacter stercoris TaxID=1628251 RepID=A0ABV2LPP6_9FLAO
MKDKERTGSIYKVTAKEIENQPVNNVLDALQGRVPGLDITPTTGLAGGGYTVRIRGQNSISAGNDPLYIIDGVPYDMGSLSNRGISGGIMPGGIVNPLNFLAPESIASVEVLKDGDATAIYGSRGANGVILITTKKGKVGKTSVSIATSMSIAEVTEMTKLLNTEQYLKMREEAFSHDGISAYPVTAYDVNGTWNKYRFTDWQKEFIGGTAINNSVKLSASGGGEQTSFTLGGNFMKESTVFPQDFYYKRTTFYSTINHRSENQKFGISFSANYGQDNNYLPLNDLVNKALTLPPNAPAILDANGNLNWENSTWNNPYADFEVTYRNNTKNLITNAVLNYQVAKGLELKTNLGYTQSELSEINLSPHTRLDPALGATSASSSAYKNNTNRYSWVIEPQLDYRHTIKKHDINITIGGTLQNQHTNELAVYASGFPTNLLMDNLSAANNLRIMNESSGHYKYLATYGRINYNYNHKYLLNLTGRRDGSSRFGTGKRFANFGAFGAAWIFSREKIVGNLNWLSFGKLRASYGITGNDQIGDYKFLNNYEINDDYYYNGDLGISPIRLFNANYGWEKNRKREIALEIGLFRNRINFEMAYYNNRSDNQIMNIPLPGTTGFAYINANLNATVENAGLEANLNTLNLKTGNFSWASNLQFSIPQNKLIAFENLENSTYVNRLSIGKSINILMLYNYIGVNPESGLFEFKDYNGDGLISSPDDRKYIVDFLPKYFGSFSNTLKYRNLAFEFNFQFVRKNGMNHYQAIQPAGFMNNQPIGVLNNWQTFTTGNNFDAYLAHNRFATTSSGMISDTSFIRLKSFSLSYSLPFKENSLTHCTLYLQGQNIFTLAKYKGGDPEQNRGFLPPLRKLSFGMMLNF